MRVNEDGDLHVNFQNPHYRMNMNGGSIQLNKTGNYYSKQNTARLIDEAFEDAEVLINHVG